MKLRKLTWVVFPVVTFGFAGSLVWLSNSKWPDLIVGGIVFVFVMRGAIRILKLAR